MKLHVRFYHGWYALYRDAQNARRFPDDYLIVAPSVGLLSWWLNASPGLRRASETGEAPL